MLGSQRKTPSVGPRYVGLTPLGYGGSSTVFRAHDRLTGQAVALKSMVRAGTQTGVPSCSSFLDLQSRHAFRSTSGRTWSRELARLAMVHEFRTLASLRHPNIVSVMDYGIDADGMPYITEELIENSRTLLASSESRPFQIKIRLLAQILRALSFLHRRHIIHCDVKPANILVVGSAQFPEVKLVDFGLSQHLQVPFRLRGAAGTPGYVAPELLAGEPPSATSDLFALGVVATELLCGRPPFRSTQLAWAQSPDFSPLPEESGLPRVLRKLLHVHPAGRYQSAAEVLSDLAILTNELVPIETHVTRSSLLQRAPLIGREQELSVLDSALRSAKMGNGSLWVISGESGIGKSRLVEELRCQALIEGFLVVHAQARSEGAFPLHLWREPLRALCVYASVDEVIEKTLRPILPDLEQLLGRPLLSTVPHDPYGTPHRIAGATSSLLQRTNQPTLLILEDLHLADGASLELLQVLKQYLSSQAVLLVGTYRCADRCTVAQTFSDTPSIHLRPLDTQAQDLLASSLVGSAATRTELAALLRRDAAGHPLFVQEVLRELLAQVGSVEELLHAALPLRVASGGMLAVIRQRLARVPAQFSSLLAHCAIAGRRLDLPSLAAAAKTGRADLSAFIETGQELGILEHFERDWRFAHDLLHEQVVAELAEHERVSLHAAVAQSVLSVYPESLEHAATLAFHFEAAKQPREAVVHLLRAADHALKIDAAKVALTHVERVLHLLPASASEALCALQCHRLKAHAYYLLGRFPDCVRALSAAECILLALRMKLRAGDGTDAYSGQRLQSGQLDAEEILMLRAGEAFLWVGQREELARRTLWAFPRLYREPRMPGLVCYVLGAAVAEMGAYSAAVRIVELGQLIHRFRHFEVGVFEAYRIRASMELRRGNWDEVERDLDTLLDWGNERGSLFRTTQAIHMKFNMQLSRNDLKRAEQVLMQLHLEATRSGIEEYLMGAELASVRLSIRRGLYLPSRERLRSIMQRYKPHEESALWSSLQVLWACVLARLGGAAEFVRAAESALLAIHRNASGLVWEGDLRILLWWELHRLRLRVPTYEGPVFSLLQQLERGALRLLKRIPIAAPGLQIIASAKAEVASQPHAALRHLLVAVQRAKALRMPFEEAWAHDGLSRTQSLLSKTRREYHSSTARSICEQSGCCVPILHQDAEPPRMEKPAMEQAICASGSGSDH